MRWATGRGLLAATLAASSAGKASAAADAAFLAALAARGEPYLAAEAALRRSPPSPRGIMGVADPLAPLLWDCLQDWAGPAAAEYQAVLDYLDGLPARFARTPAMEPSPTGTSNYLQRSFGNRVAPLLALRLAMDRGWPRWKVLAVLFHLDQVRPRAARPAVLRFAAETPDAEQRGFARETAAALR